jgi:hypothetical protein
VLGDGVLLVENVKESATFSGIVAIRSQGGVTAQLSAQNQDRSTVIFHHLQGFESDHLIDLRCPGIGHAKPLGVMLRV